MRRRIRVPCSKKNGAPAAERDRHETAEQTNDVCKRRQDLPLRCPLQYNNRTGATLVGKEQLLLDRADVAM
jgi:hypothetical protein